MPIIRNFLLVIFFIFSVLAIIGLFISPTWEVSRTIEINAQSEKIFENINNVEKWPQWIPWNREMDNTLYYEYTGPRGVNARLSWSGKKINPGKILITKSDPSNGIEYDMELGYRTMKVKGFLTFEKKGDIYLVTWKDTGSTGHNFLARIFTGNLDELIGPDFEKGLKNLKYLCENGK